MSNKKNILKINVFASEIKSRGGSVIVFAPTPEYEVSVLQCTPLWFRPIPSRQCSKAISKAQQDVGKAHSLVNTHLDKSIYFYDPLNAICDNEVCSMLDEYLKPLYVDPDHLSDYANSNYVYPDFVSFLTERSFLENGN